MHVVDEATWSWMLLAEGEEHVLSVICGTVAVYEIEFALDAEELAAYRRQGRPYIEKLADRVIISPSTFKARHIEDFHARPGVEAAIAAWRKAADAAKRLE